MNNNKNYAKQIEAEYKKIDMWEEEIAKIRSEEKQFKPNAFLFNDDPDQAEKEPLLSDAEREELNTKKENMKQGLLKLNPYDDDEFDIMKDNIKKQARSHPFDYEDDTKEQELTPDEASKLEELLKRREAAFQRKQAKEDQTERDQHSPWKRN